jgi:hypothetical protein
MLLDMQLANNYTRECLQGPPLGGGGVQSFRLDSPSNNSDVSLIRIDGRREAGPAAAVGINAVDPNLDYTGIDGGREADSAAVLRMNAVDLNSVPSEVYLKLREERDILLKLHELHEVEKRLRVDLGSLHPGVRQ